MLIVNMIFFNRMYKHLFWFLMGGPLVLLLEPAIASPQYVFLILLIYQKKPLVVG